MGHVALDAFGGRVDAFAELREGDVVGRASVIVHAAVCGRPDAALGHQRHAVDDALIEIHPEFRPGLRRRERDVAGLHLLGLSRVPLLRQGFGGQARPGGQAGVEVVHPGQWRADRFRMRFEMVARRRLQMHHVGVAELLCEKALVEIHRSVRDGSHFVLRGRAFDEVVRIPPGRAVPVLAEFGKCDSGQRQFVHGPRIRFLGIDLIVVLERAAGGKLLRFAALGGEVDDAADPAAGVA